MSLQKAEEKLSGNKEILKNPPRGRKASRDREFWSATQQLAHVEVFRRLFALPLV